MQNIETKNKFDEIIEKMITENINGIDDSLYNLEHTEKISKVFKTVDSTGSFSNLDLSRKPKMEHLKSVITMLKNYVKVGEVKKKEAGEVMTPLELVKEMLTTLPEDVWSNPNLKWLDSCNGSGPFLVMVIYKLMIGLKDWESDEEKRYKHIVENMIYAGELQPKNMFLYVSAIDPFDEYNLNIYTGSFLEKEFDIHMKTVWGLEKFSIVVGNPPYQSSSDDIRGSKSIYNLFVDKSYIISTNVLMVTPSRWFLNKNMESFRKSMLKDYGLKILNECDDNIFPNTDIKGGVSYFLISKSYIGDILFNGSLNKFESGIVSSMDINILIKYIKNQNKFLSDIFNSGSYFKIETNDNRLSNVNNGGLRCYMSKMNGLIKYINPELVDRPNTYKYKLLVPSASGGKNGIGVLGRFEISEPNEVCSSSFVHFALETMEECENLKRYLSTDFVKILIKIKKPTQRVKKDIFSLIPIVPLDIKWTNELVNEYFKISDNDYNFIKSNI
jgi:site-specific DNA-methyltransferase (adenine-specific)